jgi:GAF domain-containing protein
MSAESEISSAAGELERLRLENETLSAILGVVTSGPDLSHILDRVVDLLTRATDCHACFVYLRSGERLELRAASPIYSHLVGVISFGVDEGLAGWTIRNREAAFIREGAIDDPRTVYIAELEEERFQSMVSVPIPSRASEVLGAIVLHTAAPREFDEGVLNVLTRAASLVAGAIENARLYEQEKARVAALTRLSALGREIVGVADRPALSDAAVRGVRALLEADGCRFYVLDGPDQALRRVAADPPPGELDREAEGVAVAELLARSGEGAGPPADLPARLGLADEPAEIVAVPVSAGRERVGALLAHAAQPWPETALELLRAAAQQIALAAQKVDLIERLTEENLARDLFDALVEGKLEVAATKARAAGLAVERPHIVLEARPRGVENPGAWSDRATEAERAIKRALPDAFCDVTPTSVRALAPAGSEGAAPARALRKALVAGADRGLAIGVSEARGGLGGLAQGLREASDAATIALVRIGDEQGILLYRDTGAYRYLIDLLDSGGPRDYLRSAVEAIAAYDRERSSELLSTLDEYLSQGRSVAPTARVLYIHVNTLRQRLERIEQLTGLTIASEDLLALQLAVKLGRARV